MVGKGGNVILRTKNAIYSPCKVVSISDKNVTVSYCPGMKRDRKTGEFIMERREDTISKKDIISISERL